MTTTSAETIKTPEPEALQQLCGRMPFDINGNEVTIGRPDSSFEVERKRQYVDVAMAQDRRKRTQLAGEWLGVF
jgi:hypothetical protein